MVTQTDLVEAIFKLLKADLRLELALEDDDILAMKCAAPGGSGRCGGDSVGEEIVGGGDDFREIEDVRRFGERFMEGGEGGG
ncbi:hypothetical protein IC582_026778 [Cucumis melo]